MKILKIFIKESFIQWLVILIALSYFLFPYFPNISFEFFGKPFFITQILLITAVLLFGLKQLIERKIYWPSLFNYLIIFSGILFLSTLINNGPFFKASFSLFSLLAVTYLFSFLQQEYLGKFFKVFAWFTITAAILGILQFYIGDFTYIAKYFGYEETTYFATGFTNYPSLFGLHLAIALPLFLVFFIYSSKNERKTWLLTFFLSAIALLLTFSRGAWLALFVSFIFLFIITPSSYRRKLTTYSVVALFLVILVFYLPFKKGAGNYEYGAGKSSTQIAKEVVFNPGHFSVRSRYAFLVAAKDMVFQSPQTFLIGLGHKGFEKNWREFRPDIENIEWRDEVNSHSTYLAALTSGGIFGLLPLLIFIYLIFRGLMRIKDENYLALSLVGIMTAILVDGLFHDFLFTKYLWIFAGISLAIIKNYENQSV